jgi:nucleoside-diphosphate-sugar epimerase
MIALVTGAAGFAGSHLVDALLSKGYNVVAITRSTPVKYLTKNPKLKIVSGDILDYGSLQKALWGVDYVFHLAAISGIEETRQMMDQAWEANTKGTLNVVRASIEANVKRVLYVSTCHVFGRQATYPITEDQLPIPVDIYSASKLGGEMICRALMNHYPELDVVISRAFNHFGPRQRPEWLVPNIINQALTKDQITLMGSGDPTRDFSYVGDIVNGYITLAEKGQKGEIYNLCSGIERPVEGIVHNIADLMGFKGTIKFGEPRKADMNRSFGSPLKASNIGWHRNTTWEDGLKKTIDWYREIKG